MSMETDLTAYIATQATVTSLIGTRFEPVLNVQSQTLPAVSYQVISGPADYSQDGIGLTTWRVQLTVTGSTYASVKAVADVLRNSLAGKRWSGVDGSYVSFVENAFDGLAPPAGQAGYYLRRMDIAIQI